MLRKAKFFVNHNLFSFPTEYEPFDPFLIWVSLVLPKKTIYTLLAAKTKLC